MFGFARWPLLVRLGSLLNDNVPLAVYQRHRNGDTWAWPGPGATVTFAVEAPDEPAVGDDMVVILNVSGTIQANELPEQVRELPRFVLSPVGTVPHRDLIESPSTLEAFRAAWAQLLSVHEDQSWKAVRLWHVFAAVPVSAAIHVGRVHEAHINPTLVLYDRLDDGSYRSAIEIAGS